MVDRKRLASSPIRQRCVLTVTLHVLTLALDMSEIYGMTDGWMDKKMDGQTNKTASRHPK